MLRKPLNELVAFAAYKEQKENEDNFMELKFFCTKYGGRGLGTRFMAKIL